LWKTINAGTTWEPVFENYPSYSIGCVTIDPTNRFTIWVGTGEAVGGRHVGYGDGVYRSLDGGQSFQNMGLKQSEHIAKILVDPRDRDTIYVAAQGPLWAPGGERGLYKSTNGGREWRRILAKGPYTGATDVAFDPRNPDVVYAVTHQRHRTVAALINGGPESGIYKSTDGGASWREMKKGLPSEDKGKIAIAVSPQQPDVVYATVELAGREGGFWRSTDGGETWTKQSDFISGGTGPHYYQEIWCDPHRFDVVYQANVRLSRTEDGGKNWQSVEGRWKHVDNHAVAFHPSDPDFLLVGCDGGVYRSYDYAETYQFCANLPLTQFYKVALDNDYPFYNMVGGTQDNNTQYGPSRTLNDCGIVNSDWRAIIGGDGHDCAIDPEDPNIIYGEQQQGHLRRFDRRTGTSVDIQPQPGPGEDALRFNWDSPILISPHSHTRLYFGSKRLHRSDDRGDSWTTISPDLSRGLDRFQLPMMDRVWSIDAVWDLFAMSQFGNITSISESPLVEGLIYVGTDDGLIQVTEDGGKNWRKIEKIYGIPEFAFVNDIKADLHDPDTVYAVFDHHKTGDFKPYVMKSTDRGRSWMSIVGDLPDRQIVWRIVQDPVKPQLFFLGAEFGLLCTLDGGQHWIKLTGDMPTIPIRDLEIQSRESDLVAATFGRSFYVLDDFSPLRAVSQEQLAEEFTLFPVRKSLLYIPARVLGSQKDSQGDAFFSAPNPPFGAVLTYYLRDSLKTRQQLR
ncbi:MAG: glycosyl hydrolase, partial [Planctomycetes bacterium]|nr:glycosyl hydrolase [Planctomycetota bacterium]